MREIKFRAWSKSFGLSESFNIGGHPVFIGGATMPYWSSLAVIEQFTGLCDKNGKEIYEGDILSQGEARFIVKWDDNHAMFKCFFENKEEHYCNLDDSYIHEFFEVIGNIHEQKS